MQICDRFSELLVCFQYFMVSHRKVDVQLRLPDNHVSLSRPQATQLFVIARQKLFPMCNDTVKELFLDACTKTFDRGVVTYTF